VEQEVEYQVDDDQKHDDSDDVPGIQGFASWTSLINQPAIGLAIVDLSSSCQSLTIFKRFGPAPTNLETNDTIGLTLTTLFMTLTGLLAFISPHSCRRARNNISNSRVADPALPVICPTQG
jgi:hypothetical protein